MFCYRRGGVCHGLSGESGDALELIIALKQYRLYHSFNPTDFTD